MRKVVLLLASLILLASVGMVGLGCSDDDEDVEVTWKLSTTTRLGEYRTDIIQHFADEVSENSDGKMEIQIYLGGELHDEMTQVFEAVSSGNIDAGLSAASYYFGQMPIQGAATTYAQFFGLSLEDLAEVESRLVTEVPAVKDNGDANNVRSIMWVSGGQNGFFWKDEVKTLADCEGVEVGSAGGVAEKMSQLMGCITNVSDPTEWYMMAQTGSIAGTCALPFDFYKSLKLYEVFPWAVNLDWYILQSILVNTDSFAALDEDLQKAVLDAAADTEAWGIDYFLQEVDSQLAEIDALDGVTVYTLPADEKAAWFSTAMVPAAEGLLQQGVTDEAVQNEIKAMVNEYL